MDGLNKVILLGNIGSDPELRYTQAGQPVLNMRLATTESWFDKDSNQRKEKTEWHSVASFGKRSEGLSKILKKGDRIMVEGRLQTSSYDDREGVKRYVTNVVALNVILNGTKGGNGGGRQGAPPPDDFNGGGYGGGGSGDEDIPFASCAIDDDLKRWGL